MADLDQAYAAARKAEERLAGDRAEVAAARARLTRLRAARAEAARPVKPGDPTGAAALKKLDEQIAAAAKALDSRRDRAGKSEQEFQQANRRFGELADPVKQAGRLAGNTPVLLLPVRMETRFAGSELLVRIYPDQWAVDSFEERLSDVEVASAARFWAGWWRAGGDPDRRRAAWRGLVGSHGSGRGGWLTQQYQPTNPTAEPVRTSPDEVILVVASADPLPAGSRPAAAAFWAAVWRAGPDPDAVEAARAALASTPGVDPPAVEKMPPCNLDEAAADRATVTVTVAFLDLPAPAPDRTKITSWTQPARARVLPDRFVLLGFSGGTQTLQVTGKPVPPTLVVGPDPGAAPADQLHIENGKLVVPPELQWMIDFEQAVEVGMGFRIKLTAPTAGGFDRLFTIGLRVGAKPEESQQELELLLAHHHHSRAGLALIPQGTPTNNTEQAGAGFDRVDDADASYDWWFGAGTGLADRPDWATKQDGQWLAETLGIDPALLATVPGAAGTDQAEARAANVALWPATWGYFLDSMMHPGLTDATVEATRAFCTGYVSGRGLVPALRIGRQPYGILPATMLSKLQPGGTPGTPDVKFRQGLLNLLRKLADSWQPLAAAAPHVRSAGDPHQILLDVLGLHPASVEFHQRYAEAVDDLFNRLVFDEVGPDLLAAVQALFAIGAARGLLAVLGWTGADPEILGKVFHGSQHRLAGPLIDDRPLSETEPVRAYTDSGANYLRWLAEAARSSLDTLRREQGFTANRKPTALLYLLLRHALLLSWWDTSLRWRRAAGVLDDTGLQAARREGSFVHVKPKGASESRFQPLYSAERRVTGDDRMTLADFIPHRLADPPARHLAEVIDAIDRLSGVPTARLERVLAEHLDCASYRLDAWRLGFVHQRLLELREVADGTAAKRRGIHLGAYGWLENVRPDPGRLVRFHPPAPLDKTFDDPADPPLLRDPASGGFVHAPSLNHAATAAVLRSGYLANATPAQPDLMAVNISSERMRLALTVVQGIRHGQTLDALLGYRLERGLHDRHGLAEVDRFIHHLRLAFPSPGDRDGRLVLAGLDLVTQVNRTGNRHYPFGRLDLPAASSAEATAIDLEVARLLDLHDAVADLALAEGVHQAVLGNPDRAAATLDAYGKGGFPPEPAVLETPRSGRSLTHRFGLHLRPGLDHTVSPVPSLAMTPRATAEPAVNHFLAQTLPPPADVRVRVSWLDRAGAGHDRVVSQAEVGLQPIDLLHVLHLGGQAMAELDERILRLVETAEALPPDVAATVTIHYTSPLTGALTFFQVAALVAQLRSVLTGSRPLRATDAVLPSAGRRGLDEAAAQADRARPTAVLAALTTQQAAGTDLLADLDGLLADPVAHRGTLLSTVDDLVDAAIAVLRRAGEFGLPSSGWGDIAERRLGLFNQLLSTVDETADRWDRKLADADVQLAIDDSLPVTATDEERNRVLLLAERALSTARTDPLPPATGYRSIVDGKRAGFAAKLAALRAVRPGAATLPGALATVTGLLPLTDFDAAPLDLTAVGDGVVELAGYLRSRIAASVTAAGTRIAAGTAALADHDAAGPGQPRVDAIVAATKAMLGEDALVVPEVVLPPELAAEWAAAMSWSRTGQLTAHLAATRQFPVEDWLHGVARVRDKVHGFEQATLLAGALGRAEPELWPIQLPHAEEPWLALELPPGGTVPGDRVLYTAHYPTAFDPSAPVCGLLLDEWGETIPGDTETTGLAFHHDSPDAEAPQAMLLVVPPEPVEGWRWDDLVGTLHETLDLARARAIEPEQVDSTPAAEFLPATVMSATVAGISIATNLAVNNGVLRALGGD
ncbi:MAG TPA: hypothetical protein VMU51_04275 [Mycobacteriales bacterium]|nr:hypothetical protein [Mycobacteriales bacterium]